MKRIAVLALLLALMFAVGFWMGTRNQSSPEITVVTQPDIEELRSELQRAEATASKLHNSDNFLLRIEKERKKFRRSQSIQSYLKYGKWL